MKLKICTFNLENLFVFLDFYSGEPLDEISEETWMNFTFGVSNKPLHKLLEIAQIIKEESWDIIMGCEIGGPESLENFNKHFLNSEYEVMLKETNSRRGIDVGYLVKKGLPFDLKLRSNRRMKLQGFTEDLKFSRDVSELWLVPKGQTEPEVICLLTHLKSKISTAEDFAGLNTRKAEADGVVSIYNTLRLRHPNAKIVVGGDLNANASKERCEVELQAFLSTDLTDVHDLKQSSMQDRTTHYRVGEIHPHNQIDYLMVSQNTISSVLLEESHTYRYKERFYQIPLDFPQTMKEKWQLPSDHYPLVLTLDLTKK